jgi:polyvinyl alcohol dehydrogenase (cytochrome)
MGMSGEPATGNQPGPDGRSCFRLGATLIALVVPALSMWASTSVAGGVTALSATSSGDPSWPVYHQDAAGTGVAESVAAVDTASPAWTSPRLDGALYGEPLVSSGEVFVATENDTVYALSSSTGAVHWSTHLGTPVPSRSLPCGDITPTVGITGTPVIDQARSEIFVVADEMRNGNPAHVLVGLDTTSGRTEMTQDVDPSGSKPAALLQRTGLTLDANRVVFGFGGNYGDCSIYRGWLLGVGEAGGAPVAFEVDSASNESQGGIWMGGGAPAVDNRGDLWVGVGNGSVTSSGLPYDHSDSVLELSSSLQLLQYFAPRNWASDNANDLDLSMEPALLANGQVVAAGKSGAAYLLNGNRLGGIGGQEATVGSVCSDDVDGGTSVVGTTVFLPCLSGIVAVQASASPGSIRVLWRSRTGGGPPIVAAALVWTIGQDGVLYGLDPSTGAVKQQASIGVPTNHFPTPSTGSGILVATSANHVVAFATSATTTPSAPSSPTTVPRSNGGGVPAGAITAITAIGIVIGASVWLLHGRRRRGPT